MLPNVTVAGIMPPFVGADPTIRANMSPYRTTMAAFVQKYGTSQERLDILDGLLKYRAALMNHGITGFQWLSGSFVEEVEKIRGRPPKDIDVISVFNRPPGIAEDTVWRTFLRSPDGALIINAAKMKQDFSCDAYAIDMNEPPATIVSNTRYWFGLFAHQRDTFAWKGMAVVPIDPQEDVAARSMWPVIS